MNMYICVLLFPAAATVTGPGIVKHDESTTASITWTLSGASFGSAGTIYSIYKGSDDNPDNKIINLFVSGTTHQCDTFGNTDIDCVSGAHKLGFTIANIGVADASIYTIRIFYTVHAPPMLNSEATLYVYREYL